jgi:hypothetical protein
MFHRPSAPANLPTVSDDLVSVHAIAVDTALL